MCICVFMYVNKSCKIYVLHAKRVADLYKYPIVDSYYYLCIGTSFNTNLHRKCIGIPNRPLLTTFPTYISLSFSCSLSSIESIIPVQLLTDWFGLCNLNCIRNLLYVRRTTQDVCCTMDNVECTLGLTVRNIWYK